MENKGEIIIYKGEDGKSQLDVRLQHENIWLNLNQISALLDKDKSVISRHIKNIYLEKELTRKPTVAFFATVQKEGKRTVTRDVEYYNLDLIISVGYRVNSKRGTQFRIWATQTLKEHLVKGYTINEKRLKEQHEKFKELQETIEFLKNTVGKKELSNKETQGLLEIISRYTRSFILLNKFDSETLETNPSDKKLIYEIKYKEA
ncbi:MAG: RhuM family protein, partial [Bacteroidota bacterium]